MSISRKWSAAAILGAAALCTGAAYADSTAPVPASIQADITKTQGDVQSLHDTIVGDANKIQSDVQALTGSTDRATIAATLTADAQQLSSDRKSGNATIKADWQQLSTDWKAAHAANETKGQIAPLVKAMVTANLALRADLQQAVQAARQAAQGLRQSLQPERGQGKLGAGGITPTATAGAGSNHPGLAAALAGKSSSSG